MDRAKPLRAVESAVDHTQQMAFHANDGRQQDHAKLVEPSCFEYLDVAILPRQRRHSDTAVQVPAEEVLYPNASSFDRLLEGSDLWVLMTRTPVSTAAALVALHWEL